MNEEILPAPEPHPRNFVGQVVRFFLRRKQGLETRETGEVTAQRWLGLTKRGKIPEYEVTILGKTGRSILARVTRDNVIPV